MKAIVYEKYGGPEVLQLKEIEKPIPKDNEVLVKIHASSINSWDWDQLLGKHLVVRLIGGWFKPKYQIPGADIAGKVEAVGKNVKDFKVGDEVFGDIAGCGFGGFAEYVAVPEKLLAKKSQAMSFEEAAALPQAGLLALQGLHHKNALKQTQQILINGAGGGVGTIALQYAKTTGAEVTCVDSAEKFDMLLSLGADHLIDFKKEDYTRNGRQYDLVLDVIAHRSASDYRRSLQPGGVFVMIGGSMGSLLLRMGFIEPIVSKFSGKKLGLMGYRVNRKDLELLNHLFESGKVKPILDKRFKLEDSSEAMRYFGRSGHKGKVIISIV